LTAGLDNPDIDELNSPITRDVMAEVESGKLK